MSQTALVDFFGSWLRKPENAEHAQRLNGMTTELEFTQCALELGKAHGFAFTEIDIHGVLSSAKDRLATDEAGTRHKRLSDADLEAVAGGTRPHRSDGPPDVDDLPQMSNNMLDEIRDILNGMRGAPISSML